MEKARKNRLAIASLVFGILGLVLSFVGVGFLLGIIAIIFGVVAISQIRKEPSLGDRRMAVAGLVCGIISVAFAVIFFILMVIFAFWA
jgi:hypothetical protein